jgi:Mrp family chromosome partitioning ATPase
LKLEFRENHLFYGSKSYSIFHMKGPRKTNLIKRILKETFWGKLDFLIFDCPPGTSDEHLTVVKFLKSLSPDGAILVTTPQKMAVNTLRKEITFCNKMKLKIVGIAENMSFFSCPCCKV